MKEKEKIINKSFINDSKIKKNDILDPLTFHQRFNLLNFSENDFPNLMYNFRQQYSLDKLIIKEKNISNL